VAGTAGAARPSRISFSSAPASIRPVTAVELWRRGQRGWPRRFPIVQLPNRPLLLSLAASRVATVTAGRTQRAARLSSALGLGVWAWGETTHGTNWVRRMLGAGALLTVAARLAGALKTSSS
jgi:hypothetical protein